MRSLAVLSTLVLVGCGGSSGSGNKDASTDRSASGGRSGSGGSAANGGSSAGADAGASDGLSGQGDAAADGAGVGGPPRGGGGAGGSAGEGGAPAIGGAGGGAAGRGGAYGGAGGAKEGGGGSSAGGRSGSAGAGGATSPATGGAAGASNGGAPGAGGSTGGGAVGGSNVCFPSCLNALVQSCPTAGACTYAISIQAPGVNFCFANGVKAQNPTLPTNSGPTTSTWKNVDGSLCYTLETTLGNAGVMYAWKNPVGATVATATVANASMSMMAVMCNGTTYNVDLDSAACNGQSTQPNMTNCTLGTCSY